jgi:hypothetical protein
MRIYIPAVDVHRGDMIAHVGEVETVTIVGDDVVFTMHWTTCREHRLALDSEVWVDRKAPIVDGAA